MSASATSPTDLRRLRRLADALHAAMARFGYQRVETPIIQPADLFLTKAGDQILTRLFTFEQHGKPLALRPEFTATAAAYYAARAPGDHPVVRWQFGGQIFTNEPGAVGLGYQRYSLGGELIGLGGPLAEAEIIHLAADSLSQQGARDWQIVMGHVGLMRRLLARFGLDARTERFVLGALPLLKEQGNAAVLERLSRLVLRPDEDEGDDLLPDSEATIETNTQQILGALLDATQRNITMGGRTRHDIVRRLLQKRQRAAEYPQIVSAVEFLEQWSQIADRPALAFERIARLIDAGDADSTALLDEWRSVIDLLGAVGITPDQIRIEPDLARSWEYYTGIVFEIYSPDGQHLAGGGRYDELISLVGGEHDAPAVGFVFYPDAILDALAISPDADAAPLVIAVAGDEAAAMRWAQALRNRGLVVALLPRDQAGNEALTVTGDKLHRGERVYTLAKVDELARDLGLNRAVSDQPSAFS